VVMAKPRGWPPHRPIQSRRKPSHIFHDRRVVSLLLQHLIAFAVSTSFVAGACLIASYQLLFALPPHLASTSNCILEQAPAKKHINAVSGPDRTKYPSSLHCKSQWMLWAGLASLRALSLMGLVHVAPHEVYFPPHSHTPISHALEQRTNGDLDIQPGGALHIDHYTWSSTPVLSFARILILDTTRA
jgi:hypothetical protein